MPDDLKNSNISRREFGRRAALGSAAALVPAELAKMQEKPSSASEKSAQASAVDEDDLSPAAHAEIEARYQSVIRKWGDRLDEEQKRRVRQILVENQRMLEPIRAFPLGNSNPPGPVLRFLTEEALAGAEQRKAWALRHVER
jgi:hypothetical protein